MPSLHQSSDELSVSAFTSLGIFWFFNAIHLLCTLFCFVFQNARPAFKRVNVGSDDIESLCLRKTSCVFSRLFLRRQDSAMRAVELFVKVVICWVLCWLVEEVVSYPLKGYLSFQFFKTQNFRFDKTSNNDLLQVFFVALITSNCPCLLCAGFVVARRLIVTCAI